METPKISAYFQTQAERTKGSMIANYYGNEYGASWREFQRQKMYFKLNNPLKYKLNKTLDVDTDKTNIKVCFTVEYKSNMFREPVTKNNSSTTTNYKPIYKDIIGNFSNSHIIPISGDGEIISKTSEWYDINDAQEVLFGFESENEFFHNIVFTSAAPLGALFTSISNNWNIEYIKNTESQLNATYSIKSIKMKIIADLYFNKIGSDGRQISTTQVFTYDIFSQGETSSSNVDWLSSYQGIKKYTPGKIFISNNIITPASNNITKLIGNDIYIIADQIELKGNIDVLPGYKLNLQAFQEISTSNNGAINGILNHNIINEIINRDLYGFGINNEMTQTEVNDFCKGQNKKYKADVSSSFKRDEIEAKPINLEKQIEDIGFSLFPNPATTSILISILQNEVGSYLISISDVMGKKVLESTQVFDANNTNLHLNVSGLDSGIYFCSLYNKKGKKLIRKFIVAKQ